jgi:hypothetical protein
MDISNSLDPLLIARRLLLHAQRIEDRRKGKQVDDKTARELMEEDQAIISGKAPAEAHKIGAQKTGHNGENFKIKLSELIAQLKEVNVQSTDNSGTATQVQVQFQQVIQREMSIEYAELERVEGLVRRSNTVAETDRYKFDFSNGSTFTITDKWSGRSTTIWGDPHVDVDDVEGNWDGDFKDMSGSDSHTTLVLMDGTRVTFTAKDDGVIEAVDIFKDSQHLKGIGEASNRWNAADGQFTTAVDSAAGKSASVPQGDVVHAGGDGNDWFTPNGTLLWGKTTSPAVYSRPASVLQVTYKESITQQMSVQVNTRV